MLPLVPDASAVQRSIQLHYALCQRCSSGGAPHHHLTRQKRWLRRRPKSSVGAFPSALQPHEDIASSAKCVPGNRQRWWRKRWPCDPQKCTSDVVPWASSEQHTVAEDSFRVTDDVSSSTTSSKYHYFGWQRGGGGANSDAFELDSSTDDHASSSLSSCHAVVRTTDIQSLLPSIMDAPPSPSVESVCSKSTRKQRRREKRYMKKDLQILGMIVQFDPTFQLLEEKGEPKSMKRSTLKKLQQGEVYVDSLLSASKEEAAWEDSNEKEEEALLGFHLDEFTSLPGFSSKEEAAASKASNEEEDEALLGFHLDEFTSLSGRYNTTDIYNKEIEEVLLGFHLDEFTSLPGHYNSTDNEEIEIVFCYDDDDDQSEESSSESEDEHEIVFFACREEDSQSGSSRYSDCRSEHTPLPSEWFLPQQQHDENLVGEKNSSESRRQSTKPVTPAYEWFHPDHLDVEPVKKNLFPRNDCSKATVCTTVSTCFETSSGSHENTYDSEDDSVDVLSLGSGTSQVVQNLIEFVGI
jgi:hypothetical protein